MKTTFCILLWLGAVTIGAALPQDSPNPILQVTEISPKGTVTVRVTNPSKNAMRLWKSSNSWGGSRWRVLCIRKGRLTTINEKPQSYPLNQPDYQEIQPGGSVAELVKGYDPRTDRYDFEIAFPT